MVMLEACATVLHDSTQAAVQIARQLDVERQGNGDIMGPRLPKCSGVIAGIDESTICCQVLDTDETRLYQRSALVLVDDPESVNTMPQKKCCVIAGWVVGITPFDERGNRRSWPDRRIVQNLRTSAPAHGWAS